MNGARSTSTIATTTVTTMPIASTNRKMPIGIAQTAIIPIKRAILISPYLFVRFLTVVCMLYLLL